jgi:hypothetical protein
MFKCPPCEGPVEGHSLLNINKCYPWHALLAFFMLGGAVVYAFTRHQSIALEE